jgi:hypothetical protein
LGPNKKPFLIAESMVKRKVKTICLFQAAKDQCQIEYLQFMEHHHLTSKTPFQGILSAPSKPEWRNMPDVIFYSCHDPLKCPVDHTILIDMQLWCDGSNSSCPPRLIFGIAKNVLLVSKR